MTIGERIKHIRKKENINQEELAKILKVQRTAIVKIEKGKQQIKAEQIVELCDHFEINANWLLGVGMYKDEN